MRGRRKVQNEGGSEMWRGRCEDGRQGVWKQRKERVRIDYSECKEVCLRVNANVLVLLVLRSIGCFVLFHSARPACSVTPRTRETSQRTKCFYRIFQQGLHLRVEQVERWVFSSTLIGVRTITPVLAPPTRGFGSGNALTHPKLCHATELRGKRGAGASGCALWPRPQARHLMRAVIERNAGVIHTMLN